jgi:hypothetical protein
VVDDFEQLRFLTVIRTVQERVGRNDVRRTIF